MKKLAIAIILFISLFGANSNAFSQEQNIYSTAYMNRLQDRVKSNWVSPHGQIDEKTVIVFKINKNGQILSTDITESSGDKEFDAVALSAIKNSEPFENFATNIEGEDLTINFIFSQNLLEANPVFESETVIINDISQNICEKAPTPSPAVNKKAKPTKSKKKHKKNNKNPQSSFKNNGTHGRNGKITLKSVGAGALSLLIWPGLGQLVNGESGEKAGTHAILGIIDVFRLWSCYDAIVDRKGGVWEDRI